MPAPDPGLEPTAAALCDPPATAWIAALALEIEALLERFHLSEAEAEALLREILLLAICRWERVENPEIWLLATLRRACLRRLAPHTSRPTGRS